LQQPVAADAGDGLQEKQPLGQHLPVILPKLARLAQLSIMHE
jgi:hypothetical protein